MRSDRRASSSLLLALLLLAAAASACAQTPAAINTIEQQFAALHRQLTQAADQLLAAPVPQRAIASSASFVAVPAPPPPAASSSAALARINQLRPLLEPILIEEGVPPSLAAVALVESGGRPQALSPKGALGIWQLMPETARRFGLTVTASTDERLDAAKSTHAAARYLRELQQRFGDWQLAFAAYNAGEQAVERALRRSGASNFFQLSPLLPAETRAYVPAVHSALALIEHERPLPPQSGAARAAPIIFALASPAD